MNPIQEVAMQSYASLLGVVVLFLVFTYAIIGMQEGPLRNSIIGGILAGLMFAVYGAFTI